jgi:hypothetical protein
MKIFLSGKVDEYNGQWRDQLLGQDYIDRQHEPRWIIKTGWNHLYNSGKNILEWPVKNSIVLGTHDYTGPYRQVITDIDNNKSSGYFHGTTAIGQHGCMDYNDQTAIVTRCKEAINSSDLVFAYINSLDCFGTLAEIGYAAGRGKFVYVVYGPSIENGELWFADMVCGIPAGDNYENEGKPSLKNDLLRAISTRAAWNNPEISLLSESSFAFSQIQKWTADPRVRGEANRMITKLRGKN